MQRLSLLAPALMLFALACNSSDGSLVVDDTAGDSDADTDSDTDSDTDADSDADTDSDADCDLPIEFVDPADETEAVPVDSPLLVWFEDGAVASDASEIAFDVDGPDGAVDGSVALINGGAGASFTADEEWVRNSTYTWSVETCTDDDNNNEFSTVDDPITPNALVGRVYVIDLNEVTWTSPSSTIGGLLLGQLQTTYMLVKVQSADSSEIDLVGATGWDDPGSVEQYPCAEAIEFDPADFTGNPAFQAGPETTTLSAAGYDVEVHDFEVSGAFNGDGTTINNLQVRGYLDLASVDLGGSDACDLLAGFGVSCEACPDDGAEDCVLLDVTDPQADWESSIELDESIVPRDDC
jgi:hypothetical protein